MFPFLLTRRGNRPVARRVWFKPLQYSRPACSSQRKYGLLGDSSNLPNEGFQIPKATYPSRRDKNSDLLGITIYLKFSKVMQFYVLRYISL